jgi:hypothetical protein
MERSSRQFSITKYLLHLTSGQGANHPRTTEESKLLCQERLSSSLPAPSKVAILNAPTRKRKVRDRTLLNLAHRQALHLELYFLGLGEAVYNAQALNAFQGDIDRFVAVQIF